MGYYYQLARQYAEDWKSAHDAALRAREEEHQAQLTRRSADLVAQFDAERAHLARGEEGI